MNILFINPSSMPYRELCDFLTKKSILRNPSFTMPIGLIDLSAYIRDRHSDIYIEILDIGKDLHKIYLKQKDRPSLTFESFIQEELNSITFIPDIIGISVSFSTSHLSSIKIIETAKLRWKQSIVLCGGNHATNCTDILIEEKSIDYVVRGEGEISFTEFLENFKNGHQKLEVCGIAFRGQSEKKNSKLSRMIENLDDIPIPAYDLLDLEAYRKTVGASIMLTRGCVFHCTFCASSTVHGKRVRYKSNDRIIEEFNLLIKNYNFKKLLIEDDLFAHKKRKFLKIAEKITSLNENLEFRLPQGLSVAMLDTDIIDAMIKMGINEGNIAIESGSPYTQKHIIKKNVSLNKAREILRYLRQKDFYIYVNFILGFAGETRTLMQETIDFIKALDVDWAYIFHALPLPGSEMFNTFSSMGIIDKKRMDWDGLRLGCRTFDTPEISALELENLTYDTNIEINFFHNSNIKNGRYQRAIDIFTNLIINAYPFHVVGRYCRATAYFHLNQNEMAEKDLRDCSKWIKTNEESKRLYTRYSEQMTRLNPYLNDLSSP